MLANPKIGKIETLRRILNNKGVRKKLHSAKGGRMKTFSEKVYDILRKVPKGRVTTYKEIANALGTKAYRGVGQAMRRNPYAPEVP